MPTHVKHTKTYCILQTRKSWTTPMCVAIGVLLAPSITLARGEGEERVEIRSKIIEVCREQDEYSITSLLPEKAYRTPLGNDAASIQWLSYVGIEGRNNPQTISAVLNRDIPGVKHTVEWSAGGFWTRNLPYCGYAYRAQNSVEEPTTRKGPLVYGRDSTAIATEAYRPGAFSEFAIAEQPYVVTGDGESEISVRMSWTVNALADGRSEVVLKFEALGDDGVALTVVPAVNAPLLAMAVAKACDGLRILDPGGELEIPFVVDSPRPVGVGIVLTWQKHVDNGTISDDAQVVSTRLNAPGG